MYPEHIENLIYYFSCLPGVGKKTAQRFVFSLLGSPDNFLKSFSKSLAEIKERIKFCTICHNISEEEKCTICRNPKREHDCIMVVVDYSDVFALEKTNEYQGVYHVLGGVLSPLDGIGLSDLNLSSLFSRITSSQIKELIFALTPNTEGEATLSYILEKIKNTNIRSSRLARGVPVGAQLEFVDQITLGRAITGRNKISLFPKSE